MRSTWEFRMHQPSRRFLATLASRCRFRKPGLAAILLGGRVLIACAIPPHAFAHEPHPADPPAGLNAEESAFLKENDAAMTKMMNDMAVKPTGDVDRDFVAMMSPHHQGAIDMSEAELRYGHNEQLIRIAQDIVVEELQEIAAMHAASGERLTPTEATLAASFAGTAAGQGLSSPVPADNVPPSLKR